MITLKQSRVRISKGCIPLFHNKTDYNLEWGHNYWPHQLWPWPRIIYMTLLIGCGLTYVTLTWLSDIQLHVYSDGTVVQFPNLDLLPGTQRHGQLGSLACRAYPDTGTRTSQDVFNLLAIRGPTGCEGMLGIEPRSAVQPATSMPPVPAIWLLVMDNNTVVGTTNVSSKSKLSVRS